MAQTTRGVYPARGKVGLWNVIHNRSQSNEVLWRFFTQLLQMDSICYLVHEVIIIRIISYHFSSY